MMKIVPREQRSRGAESRGSSGWDRQVSRPGASPLRRADWDSRVTEPFRGKGVGILSDRTGGCKHRRTTDRTVGDFNVRGRG